MIRVAWIGLNIILATVPLSLIVIIASFTGAPAALFEWAPRTWSRWVLWASGVRVQLEGLQHIAADRPLILAANHSTGRGLIRGKESSSDEAWPWSNTFYRSSLSARAADL